MTIETDINRAEEIVELELARIGQRYRDLRLVKPSSEAAMVRSLRIYGQLSPAVVCRTDDKYELLDGFKRYRACQKLQTATLMARVLKMGPRACKAAILQLNWAGSAVSAMEEAMVVLSLHQDEGLTQVEIATLLGRHKSWVCRRISLVERLCAEALEAIQKHRLDCRETARLVHQLLSRPRWEHPQILRCLWLLEDRTSAASKALGRRPPPSAAVTLRQRLLSMSGSCRSLSSALTDEALAELGEEEMGELAPLMDEAIGAGRQSMARLRQAISFAASHYQSGEI